MNMWKVQWDLDRPTRPPVILPDYEATVRVVAFAADGKRLVTSEETEDALTARIWKLSSYAHPLESALLC